jgi:hypothetical protein
VLFDWQVWSNSSKFAVNGLLQHLCLKEVVSFIVPAFVKNIGILVSMVFWEVVA